MTKKQRELVEFIEEEDDFIEISELQKRFSLQTIESSGRHGYIQRQGVRVGPADGIFIPERAPLDCLIGQSVSQRLADAHGMMDME